MISVTQENKINRSWFNILKSELHLVETTLERGNYDYYHLISGQDYPTRNINEFKYLFKEKRGIEFIRYSSLPKKYWWRRERLKDFIFVVYMIILIIELLKGINNKYDWTTAEKNMGNLISSSILKSAE